MPKKDSKRKYLALDPDIYEPAQECARRRHLGDDWQAWAKMILRRETEQILTNRADDGIL